MQADKVFSIDKIVFGNPCLRDHRIISTTTYLDKLIPSLKALPPAPNSSTATIEELNLLASYARLVKNKNDYLYDEDLINYIKGIFINAGASAQDINDTCDLIMTDVVPLVTKLKYFFNRPRPAQLAYYYDLELYPDFSYFTNNPSYPSGHTTMTAITVEVLGNHYPDMYMTVKKLFEDVKKSRLHLGVHYPSDNLFAITVARSVLANVEFKKKHKL